MTIVFLGIDLAKNVFALHGVDRAGKAVLVRPVVRRDQLLELARALIQPHELQGSAAAGAANPQVVVVRVLAAMVEPALALLGQIRGAWRQELWGLPCALPRVWLDHRRS